MHMIVTCPQCSTDFPVDPAKVPDSGVLARCSICPEVFRVDERSLVSAETEDFAEPTTGTDPWDAGFEVGEPVIETEPLEVEAEAEVAEPVIEMPDPVFEATEPVAEMEASTEVNTNEFGERELSFDVTVGDEPGGLDATVEVEDSPYVEAPVEADPEPVAEVEAESVAEVEAEPVVEAEPQPEAESEPATDPAPAGAVNPFGQRSPADRAKSLARSLVSDITAYHSGKYTLSVATGTLKEDFAEEIEKSWKEYSDQVPQEVIDSESFFNDALNDILAQGAHLFDHEG